MCVRPNTFFWVRKTSTPSKRGLLKAWKARHVNIAESLLEESRYYPLLALARDTTTLFDPRIFFVRSMVT